VRWDGQRPKDACIKTSNWNGRVMTAQRSLMNYGQAAQYLGTTERHVRRLREYEEIEFVKVGRLVRFRPEALDAYIEANTVHPARNGGCRSGP
jgi:excisionase family DNA binding protein